LPRREEGRGPMRKASRGRKVCIASAHRLVACSQARDRVNIPSSRLSSCWGYQLRMDGRGVHQFSSSALQLPSRTGPVPAGYAMFYVTHAYAWPVSSQSMRIIGMGIPITQSNRERMIPPIVPA
jgi:hypothetical protein